MTRSPKQQIKHYLDTGLSDVLPEGWPGEDWMSMANEADRAMRDALTQEVKSRVRGLSPTMAPVQDLHAFTRAKVAPMVEGLFVEAERENVLATLEKSVVFLTADNIEEILRHISFRHSAWTLANLYLLSVDAPLLSKTASRLVGLSEATTCYVSPEYFIQNDRFADFIVHEAAHVFHNCKRSTVGLPETRSKEFLLNIDFRQRETFAYACEVYSRILELADSRKERIALAEEPSFR